MMAASAKRSSNWPLEGVLMKLVVRMVEGLGLITEAYAQPRRYPIPARNGFASDAIKLGHDVRVFGSDAKKAVAKVEKMKHGQPANAGQCTVSQW
jgi:hypothetical protein